MRRNSGFPLLTSLPGCLLVCLLGSVFVGSFLVGCQTTPKKSVEGVRFYKGKAQIFDKMKDKQDWVYFSSSIEYPRRLRMDMNLVLLNIGLGSVVIDGNKATMVSSLKKEAFTTDDGSRLLEKLMKTDISPRDVIAIFDERFPIPGWRCEGPAEKPHCAKGDLQFEWEALAGNERRLILDSSRSRVTFVYKSVDTGNTNFDLKIPPNYEIKEL